MSAWMPSAAVPPELRGAPVSQWLRHPAVLFRATLLVAAVDVVATCRHLRRHPDAPDVRPLALSPAPAVSTLPQPALHPTPTSPDPRGGRFTLAEALDGLACAGAPVARLETSLGDLRCELWPERAPAAVAGFVGLARGRREFWDAAAGAWVRRPFYDGTAFHYVVPGRLIEAGDPLRAGATDTGLALSTETRAPHDRAGLLCLITAATGAARGQFTILALPRPDLDGRHPVFGRCAPAARVEAISEVPAAGGSPRTPVVVRRVTIDCGAPGA